MVMTQDNLTMLDKACAAARAWQRTSFKQGKVTFSVKDKGVMIVLEGDARSDFDEWQLACAPRAANDRVISTRPANGNTTIFFKVRDGV